MNFSLILAIEFPDKKIMEVLRSENLKYDKNLLIVFLVDTLFFVLDKWVRQKSWSSHSNVSLKTPCPSAPVATQFCTRD